jgi:5,10-methylenetetrahydromethanopterin reductase
MPSADDLDVSVALPPGGDAPALVALAEELGYRRAWLYDSPALYHDVWMTLARAADRTTTIGLGPAVLVPSLRHPMVNAAAIATLEELAPGRVAVALGAGFTGRHALGQRAMRWADVREYVTVLRALLRGDEAEWEGRPIRMVHTPGYGPPRPIEVPILLGADGPQGTAAARELADGAFAAGLPNTDPAIPWRALLQFGTVMDEGEAPTDARVVEAAGPAVCVAVHGLYERGGPAVVDGLPGGAAWRAALEELDPRNRHLATHEGHLVALTDRDRAALADGLTGVIPAFTLSGTAEEVRTRVDALADGGVTELAYQPSASDAERDLRSFAAALALSPAPV